MLLGGAFTVGSCMSSLNDMMGCTVGEVLSYTTSFAIQRAWI
jgi:hypothetical protein